MNNFLINFGNRARSRRQELGYTLEEVAKKMGYNSRTAVLNIEQGLSDVPLSRIISLAKALQTTPAYLMDWLEMSETAQNIMPEVIAIYKKLDKEHRNYLLVVARGFLYDMENANEIKKSI